MTGFAEVSEILWRERELLDVLLFKLETQRLLVEAGDLRWLSGSTREIAVVLEQLRLVEITRAMEVDALAVERGLPVECVLGDLVAVSPSPWRELFAAHRVALASLTAEIHQVAVANEGALSAACVGSERRLAELGVTEVDGPAAIVLPLQTPAGG